MVLLAILPAAWAAYAQSSREDRLSLRKIEQLCQENADSIDMRNTLQCWALQDLREDILADMSYHLTGLCKAIAEGCGRAEQAAMGDRLEVASTTLQCSKFGYRCERSSPIVAMVRNRIRDKAQEQFGDLRSVVDTLESLGTEIPSSLKRAAILADEAYRIGQDYGEAARQMDRQLHMFYARLEKGCPPEDPGLGMSDCAIRVLSEERKFQARAVERVLNWNSPTSVVSCGTDAVIARWKSQLGMGAAQLTPCPRAR